MSPVKFAERQNDLFRKGKIRADAYRKEWDRLEMLIRSTYERLADELGKYFNDNSFFIFSSNDARMHCEYPFVQFCIYRIRFATESILPVRTVLLFVQGLYGEVTVAFRNYDLHEGDRHIYRVYARPSKISEKDLEKILSRYFEYIAEQSFLNKPSYWNRLKSIRSHFVISRKVFIYNRSPLIALKSMAE